MFLSRLALHYDYCATAAFEERQEQEEEEAEEEEKNETNYHAAAAAVTAEAVQEEDDDETSAPFPRGKEDGERRLLFPTDDTTTTTTTTTTTAPSTCCAALQRVADTAGVPSGSAWQDVCLSYLVLGLLAFFAASLAVPCFRFHYQGLAGWVLAHVTQAWPDVSPPTKTSTVVSLGLGVPSATDDPNALGVRYLQAAFLFFVVGAPLGCLVLLLALTLLPVRAGGQLLTAAEVRRTGWYSFGVY
jgi:hypothetical protein